MEKSQLNQEIYTLGIWRTKADKKEEFIKEWTAFAYWTSENIPGAGTGYLLQDKNDSLRFISYGPWASEESISTWRESSQFKEFVSKVKNLCDDFQPNTFKVISSSN